MTLGLPSSSDHLRYLFPIFLQIFALLVLDAQLATESADEDPAKVSGQVNLAQVKKLSQTLVAANEGDA
jgi:hypothetical protein